VEGEAAALLLDVDFGLTGGVLGLLVFAAREGDPPNRGRGLSLLGDSGLATVNTDGSGFGVFGFLGMLARYFNSVPIPEGGC